MKMLDLGHATCAKFCGLMDMPPFFFHSTHDIILQHIRITVKSVFDLFAKLAVKQETRTD